MIEFLLSNGKEVVVEWKELRQQMLLQQQQQQQEDEEDEFMGIEKMIIKGFSNLSDDNNNKKKKSVVSNPNPNSTPNPTTSNNMNRVTLNVSNVLLSAVCSGIMSYILLSSNRVKDSSSISGVGGDDDSFVVIFSIITGFMVLLVELYFILKYIS